MSNTDAKSIYAIRLRPHLYNPFGEGADWGRLMLVFGIVIVALIHASGLTGGFTSDSLSYVGSCAKLSGFDEWRIWLIRQFTHGNEVGSNFYRPIGNLSLCTDYLLYGSTAIGWRLTQLSLHLLNGVLVYRLTKRLFPAERHHSIAAPLAALIFWLSPAAPEVSIWIVSGHSRPYFPPLNLPGNLSAWLIDRRIGHECNRKGPDSAFGDGLAGDICAAAGEWSQPGGILRPGGDCAEFVCPVEEAARGGSGR